MTTRLAQRLQRARDRFLTEIARAVEEELSDAIEQAFTFALATRSRQSMSPRSNLPTPAQRRPTPPATPTESAQVTRDRVLASIQDAPGSHIGELSQSLGLPASTVRRHVRQLATADAIRIEATPDPRFGGGQPRQLFFPQEPGNGVPAEHAARAAEATT